ncbi:hypothetical protein [[Eubacterium] cellulosolvens]
MIPIINPVTDPKAIPQQIIRKVQGCILGKAANGILSAAIVVPNTIIIAISLEVGFWRENSIITARIAIDTIVIEIKPHCSIIELYPKKMKYIGKKIKIIDNSAIDIVILFLECEFIATQQLNKNLWNLYDFCFCDN